MAPALAVKSLLPAISLYLESVKVVIDLNLARLEAEVAFRLPPVILLGLIGMVPVVRAGEQTAAASGAPFWRRCCRC